MTVYNEPVWAEPTITHKKGKYERVLLPLMEEGGVWAKIGEYKSNDSAYQAALNLKHGRYRIPGDLDVWEFVSNDNYVFARYGEGENQE